MTIDPKDTQKQHQQVKSSNLDSFILDPSRQVSFSSEIIPRLVGSKLPSLYKEIDFKTTNCDKIFASVWLNRSEIVLGSKCNKIWVLDINTGFKREIPTIVTKPALVKIQDSDLEMENHEPLLELPVTPSYYNRQLCYGIHSLSINPSRTLLAVGAGRPTEFIQVLNINVDLQFAFI